VVLKLTSLGAYEFRFWVFQFHAEIKSAQN